VACEGDDARAVLGVDKHRRDLPELLEADPEVRYVEGIRQPEADGRGRDHGKAAKRDVSGACVLQIESELEQLTHKFVFLAGGRKVQLRQRRLQVSDAVLAQLVPAEALAPQKRDAVPGTFKQWSVQKIERK
jgi:hypothetical protein